MGATEIELTLPAGGAADTPPIADSGLWDRVDRLVDRAPRLSDLRAHKLHLVAARRWRRGGRTADPMLVQDERAAGVVSLAVPLVLERARDAYDGRMIVMKGPEAAAAYPDPLLRPFKDIDILVDDAPAAQRALLGAGFREVGDERLFVDIHHLRPLHWPGLPLVIELHARPKWVDWASAPPLAELLGAAIPSASGIDGVDALRPCEHALVLAAHSWAHEPLRRLLELVDVAAVAALADPAEIEAVARRWGVTRLWLTTARSVDSVLFGGRRPIALRVWARNLVEVRERTVLESHLEHWLSPFSVLSPRRAVAASGRALARDLRPESHETWGPKLARSARAIRNAFTRRSDHDRELAEGKRQP